MEFLIVVKYSNIFPVYYLSKFELRRTWNIQDRRVFELKKETNAKHNRTGIKVK